MAITVKSLRDWLSTLNSEAAVAIDFGGLCLEECGGTACLEVGGEEEGCTCVRQHDGNCAFAQPKEPSNNDEVLCCPDCEKPNQFGEQCYSCMNEAALLEADRA